MQIEWYLVNQDESGDQDNLRELRAILHGSSIMDVRIEDDGNEYYANYYISHLPGCCGVAVVSSISDFYRHEIGTVLARNLHRILKELNYTSIMVSDTRPIADSLLREFNLEQIHKFRNKRSNNTVIVWVGTV